MLIRVVTWICYMVALLSVIASIGLALLLIWRPDVDAQILYRSMATTGTFFAAAFLVLLINATFRKSLK
jgi:hypothetical protein